MRKSDPVLARLDPYVPYSPDEGKRAPAAFVSFSEPHAALRPEFQDDQSLPVAAGNALGARISVSRSIKDRDKNFKSKITNSDILPKNIPVTKYQ